MHNASYFNCKHLSQVIRLSASSNVSVDEFTRQNFPLEFEKEIMNDEESLIVMDSFYNTKPKAHESDQS